MSAVLFLRRRFLLSSIHILSILTALSAIRPFVLSINPSVVFRSSSTRLAFFCYKNQVWYWQWYQKLCGVERRFSLAGWTFSPQTLSSLSLLGAFANRVGGFFFLAFRLLSYSSRRSQFGILNGSNKRDHGISRVEVSINRPFWGWDYRIRFGD